jgi:Tfp pilus assembly protein PilF
MVEEVRLRRWRRLLPFLLLLLLAGSCSRLPKIIVLEDPLTVSEHVNLGVAYERNGELDLAQREYERALRKDGKSFRARVNLGNIFLAKKEYGKAREEYLLALELQPGDPEATNNLSWAAIYSGEGIDEALTRMESVVSVPGGRQPALLDTLGVLRMHANRPGPAAEAFALADALCRPSGAAPREGVTGNAPCPEEVLREIEDHRAELRRRFP